MNLKVQYKVVSAATEIIIETLQEREAIMEEAKQRFHKGKSCCTGTGSAQKGQKASLTGRTS